MQSQCMQGPNELCWKAGPVRSFFDSISITIIVGGGECLFRLWPLLASNIAKPPDQQEVLRMHRFNRKHTGCKEHCSPGVGFVEELW